MRKLLIIGLACVMLLSMTACDKETTEEPTVAPTEAVQQEIQEESPQKNDEWNYDESTKTLYVNTDVGMFEPDAPDFDGTTSNAPWNTYLGDIENIVISDGVSSVGDYAFAFCTNLKNVESGRNVETLAFRCFFKCGDWDNDTSINFYFNSTPNFGDDVFGWTWENPNVTIYVPDDMKDYWADYVMQKG